MSENPRAKRLADRIREIIATRLDRGMRDPRLGFVTITEVRVTGDLQHATVFYTVYGGEQEVADSAAALASATGMLRSEVGKNITARLTPSLEFQLDAMPENASHIDELLREAKRRDDDTVSMAAGAQHAGDADPYRQDEDEAEEAGEAR